MTPHPTYPPIFPTVSTFSPFPSTDPRWRFLVFRCCTKMLWYAPWRYIMINDPKSCSLIKTRRAKIHQEGLRWRCSGGLGFPSPPSQVKCRMFLDSPKGRVEGGRGESKMAGSCVFFLKLIVCLFFRSM